MPAAKEIKSKEKRESGKKSRFSMVHRLIMGELVSYEFFFRYWVYVLVIVFIFIAYISSRYQVQSRMAEIIKLKTELANVRTEKVKASATYNSFIREPEMRQRLQKANINLQVPDQPPYVLKK